MLSRQWTLSRFHDFSELLFYSTAKVRMYANADMCNDFTRNNTALYFVESQNGLFSRTMLRLELSEPRKHFLHMFN